MKIISENFSNLNNAENLNSVETNTLNAINKISGIGNTVKQVIAQLSDGPSSMQIANVIMVFKDSVNFVGSNDDLKPNNNSQSLVASNVMTEIANLGKELITPSFSQQFVSLVGPSTELSTSEYNDYINEQLNTLQVKQQFIKGLTDVELNNINVVCSPGTYTKGNWGQTSYNVWKQGQLTGNIESGTQTITGGAPKVIIYNNAKEKIALNNNTNLHDYLSTNDNLQNIVNLANGNANLTKASLVASSDVFFDKNVVHINISAMESEQQKFYDLQIPYSCINFSLQNSILSISGNNITPIFSREFTINYNIGINDGIKGVVDYTNPNISLSSLPTGENPSKDANLILTNLGWGQNSGVDETNFSLNTNNISQALGIYNVEFSNPILNKINNPFKEKRNIKNNLNPNQYTLTFTATPNNNFVWNDGSGSTPKQITTNTIYLTSQTAVCPKTISQSVSTFDVTGQTTTASIDGLKTFLQTPSNFQNLIESMKTVNSNQFENVDITFKDCSGGSANSATLTNPQITIEVTPSPGFSWKNQSTGLPSGATVGGTETITLTFSISTVTFK